MPPPARSPGATGRRPCCPARSAERGWSRGAGTPRRRGRPPAVLGLPAARRRPGEHAAPARQVLPELPRRPARNVGPRGPQRHPRGRLVPAPRDCGAVTVPARNRPRWPNSAPTPAPTRPEQGRTVPPSRGPGAARTQSRAPQAKRRRHRRGATIGLHRPDHDRDPECADAGQAGYERATEQPWPRLLAQGCEATATA